MNWHGIAPKKQMFPEPPLKNDYWADPGMGFLEIGLYCVEMKCIFWASAYGQL